MGESAIDVKTLEGKISVEIEKALIRASGNQGKPLQMREIFEN